MEPHQLGDPVSEDGPDEDGSHIGVGVITVRRQHVADVMNESRHL